MEILKSESQNIIQKNREIEKYRKESNVDFLKEEIEEERKRSMGIEQMAKQKYE